MWNNDISSRVQNSSTRRKREILVALVALIVVGGIILGLTLGGSPNGSTSPASKVSVDIDVVRGYSEFGMRTLNDFEAILSSDIRVEINSKTSGEEKWQNINHDAWGEMILKHTNNQRDSQSSKSNQNDESQNGIAVSFPFIICISSSSNDNLLVSDGHDRMSGFISSIIGNDLDVEELTYIYNHVFQTCAYLYMQVPSLSTLQNMKDSEERLIVQPLLPNMKIRASTIEKSRTLTRDEKIIIEVCPNVIPSNAAGSDEKLKFLADTMMKSLRGDSQNQDISSNLRKASQTDELADNVCSLRESSKMLHALEYSVKMASYGMHHITIDLELAIRYHAAELNTCIDYIISFLSSASTVCSVSISDSITTLNEQAQWISQGGTKPGDTVFFDMGLDGSGQIVGVSDTGLDTDNCYFWDSNGDIVKDGRIDKSKRKVVQYVPYKDTLDEEDGHGTHVVGTILGRRASDGKSEADGIADGVARGAKVTFYDLAHKVYGNLQMSVPPSAFQYVGLAGSKIHSASWGTQTTITYSALDQTFDDYLYQEPDTLIVVAAGNKGENGSSTIASPAISKNTIVVGASQSSGPDIYDYMLGHEYMAYFSARGPTLDGRIGIDVVAPGSYILSSASKPTIIGECDDSNGTRYDQGTSMATPVVSGSAAIIRQYFEEGWFPSGLKKSSNKLSPSGALIKAVILNGAQSMKGFQDKNGVTKPVSDYDEYVGFGRLNLLASLPLQGKNDFKAIVIDRKAINRGEKDEITFHIDKTTCSSNMLSVTLVWMDPPAVNGCTRCLVNDLDLYLEKKGSSVTYYPNGKSIPDSDNNVERIRIPVVHGEEYKMYIHGKNLISKDQLYSLVVTGCVFEGSYSSPTSAPTKEPTQKPIPNPSSRPTKVPTPHPTFPPSKIERTLDPTLLHTSSPTLLSSSEPSSRPTISPTNLRRTPAPSDLSLGKATTIPTITPTFSLSSSPTQLSTLNPSLPATNMPTNSQLEFEIRTNLSGNTKSHGNMFDIITSDKNLFLHGVDIHVDSMEMEVLEVYFKSGSFIDFARHPSAWNAAIPSIVFGKGYGISTKFNLQEHIALASGTTTAFYFTLRTPNMVYSVGNGIGNVAASNEHMSILEGAGKVYPFKNTFVNRTWNGAFQYSVNTSNEMDVGETSTESDHWPTISPFDDTNEDKAEISVNIPKI